MSIAIFGGSFDPPHAGHVAIVESALAELPIETLYVVPAYLNPFKTKVHAPASQRLKWLEHLFSQEQKVVISDFELRQERPVPTIETIRHFRQIDPGIYLIIGADNLDDLSRWHHFETLDSMVSWVVASRDGHAGSGMLRTLHTDVNVSSTELRAQKKPYLIPSSIREEVKNFYKGDTCKND